MLMALLSFLKGNGLEIMVVLLTIDRAMERLFPNAQILAKLDALMASAGIKDVDGQ